MSNSGELNVRSLNARLQKEATRVGGNVQQVRRRFVYQRFLCRLFQSPSASSWVLKGGANLLLRMPFEARASLDIDLYRTPGTVEAAVADLRAAAAMPIDPFRFEVSENERPLVGGGGVTLAVTAYLGTANVQQFSIDVVVEKLPVSPEIFQPAVVIEHPSLSSPPPMWLYPIPDHVADKVCAIYEVHNGWPSSRYRDLVDLVLILANHEVDPETVAQRLSAQSRYRSLVLPKSMIVPGPQWESGFRKAARDHLPEEQHSLDVALRTVGMVLDPLLNSCGGG